MDFTKREILVYAIIAIVIIVVVAVVASSLIYNKISVSVQLQQVGQVGNPIYPYQTAYLIAQINNTGATQINNLVFGTYVNGQTIHTYTINLPPKTGVQVNITYTYTAGGTYQFQAIADPAHLLNIQNGSSSSASLTYNVATQQQPDVYTSIPNNNIKNSETFSLQSYGLDQVLFTATEFNLSYFSKMVDLNSTPTLRILEDLSPYINAINGAYTTYSNTSSVYVAWLQSIATPASAKIVVSSFGLATKPIGSNNGFFTALSNTSSLCVVYDHGWTKIVQYNNMSTPATCLSIMNTTYNATETTSLVNSLKAYPNMTGYQNLFIYTNSTSTGSALSSYNNSIASMRLFQVSNSFFASYIARNPISFNAISQIPKCIGSIYSSGNVNVCSYGLAPTNKTTTSAFYLVNSTEVNKDYTVTLYSLVNYTKASQAQLAAIALINYLNLTGSSYLWKSSFNSTCSFENATPPCSVTNFNFSTKYVSMAITNPFKSPMRLNDAACFISGFEVNSSVNQLIASGQNTVVTVPCLGAIPGLFNPLNTYSLQLNYTLNNVVQIVNGTLGIPS